jgi:hypothetical protein
MAISIEPSAFGPVKAVAAEHVVAHWLSEQGGSPTLYGGRRKGHDVTDGEQLIDAKLLVPASASEAKREGCTRKLRHDLWKAFDPDRTTQVMLVEFPSDWTGQRHLFQQDDDHHPARGRPPLPRRSRRAQQHPCQQACRGGSREMGLHLP